MCLRGAIDEAISNWPCVMVDQRHYIDPGKTDGLYLTDKIVEKCHIELNQPDLSERDYEIIIEKVSHIGSMREINPSELYKNIINIHHSIENMINMKRSKEEIIAYSLYLYYSYLLLKSMCRIYYGNNVDKITKEHRTNILKHFQNYQGNPCVKVGIIMARIYDKDCPRDDSWIPKNHFYWENIK